MIISEKDGYLTEKNGSKYLIFNSTYKNKEVLKKYTKYDNIYDSIHNMTIVIRSVFEEDGKFYPQIYLGECLHELWMLEYDRIDISEGIDIDKTNGLKEFIFVIIGSLKILILNINHIFVMVVMV